MQELGLVIPEITMYYITRGRYLRDIDITKHPAYDIWISQSVKSVIRKKLK